MVRMIQYNCYIDVIKDKIYICRILRGGQPDLDSDNCYNFTELHKPPSQEFLNRVNKIFRNNFQMYDFNGEENTAEMIPDTSGLLWEQKNRKELEK